MSGKVAVLDDASLVLDASDTTCFALSTIIHSIHSIIICIILIIVCILLIIVITQMEVFIAPVVDNVADLGGGSWKVQKAGAQNQLVFSGFSVKIL